MIEDKGGEKSGIGKAGNDSKDEDVKQDINAGAPDVASDDDVWICHL